MKLWILDLIERRKPLNDKAFGFIVRAKDEEQARLLASQQAGAEGAKAWLNPKKSKCFELNPKGEAEVLLRDCI